MATNLVQLNKIDNYKLKYTVQPSVKSYDIQCAKEFKDCMALVYCVYMPYNTYFNN